MAPAISVVSSIGARALATARAQMPGAVEAAKQYLAKSGKDIETLALRDNDKGAQSAVLVALGKGGFSGSMFATAQQLSDAERRQYARVLNVMNEASTKAVDAKQVGAVGDSAESYVRRIGRNQEIEFVCRQLGCNSDTLARLILAFQTITSHDVELYQLDPQRRIK